RPLIEAMTSPPLLLRLQADSPISRNVMTMTRLARFNQLHFFKFFPPPRRRVNPTTSIPGAAQNVGDLKANLSAIAAYFDGAAGGVFASAAGGLCSGGATPASFNAWSSASRTSSVG